MSATCPKCFARKWSNETNGMCCTASKVILPDTEEPPEPVKKFLDKKVIIRILREGNFMLTFKIEVRFII